MHNKTIVAALVAGVVTLAGCGSSGSSPSTGASSTTTTTTTPTATAGATSTTTTVAPKNVIFFLGDGMGINTLTAARIYKYGEEGSLTIDELPESAFVRTYSNNAQVTDSAPSMAAYMTGVKMNNEVISMTPETMAYDPVTLVDYLKGADSNCPASGNGKAVTTLLELAKAKSMATGAVTTTRLTHATPAVTYSHICHRDGENDIAAQAIPGSTKYNAALADGVDVLLGGGRRHFVPSTVSGSKRTDAVDLTALAKTAGYSYVTTGTDLGKLDAASTKKVLGLFNMDHMNYDLDRTTKVIDEPSLADMTTKAIDILKKNANGFFLMVEGGRIDHALHSTNAKRALQDTIAFDDAIKAAIAKVKTFDPNLENTLIVVTADHDHTIVLNGYAKRTGPSSPTNPGVLGLVKNVLTGLFDLDSGALPYSIIGFGNGENRPATRAALTEATVWADDYHQEAAIPTAVGSETHGGTDVFLGAMGKGADLFTGTIDNTDVFGLVRKAIGL